MTPGEIVELYEQMVTQDGSAFALKRVAPGRFGDQPGFRFEHTITRKSDNVLLKGVGQGAVVKGKLYLVAFTAPSIYYYDRYLPQVEPLLASAGSARLDARGSERLASPVQGIRRLAACLLPMGILALNSRRRLGHPRQESK